MTRKTREGLLIAALFGLLVLLGLLDRHDELQPINQDAAGCKAAAQEGRGCYP